MNQMTPITRKRKAKKDSLQEQFEKKVELVGVYDNAEDMVKALEQPAKKPKKTRFETEPDVANMVEQTRAAAEITKNTRKTLQEEFTQMVEELDSSKKEDTLYDDLQMSPAAESVVAADDGTDDLPSSLTVEPPTSQDNEGLKRMVRLATIFQSPGFQKSKPKKPDHLLCPFHINRMEQRKSKGGWRYLKCPYYNCQLFCDEQQAPQFLEKVEKTVDPTVYDQWCTMTCLCGELPILKQSRSEKNPDRLYLCCSGLPEQRCKFFRWADQPIQDLSNLPTTDPAWQDPVNVQQWLLEAPAGPPPKYSDSYQEFQRKLQDCHYDYLPKREPATWERPRTYVKDCYN